MYQVEVFVGQVVGVAGHVSRLGYKIMNRHALHIHSNVKAFFHQSDFKISVMNPNCCTNVSSNMPMTWLAWPHEPFSSVETRKRELLDFFPPAILLGMYLTKHSFWFHQNNGRLHSAYLTCLERQLGGMCTVYKGAWGLRIVHLLSYLAIRRSFISIFLCKISPFSALVSIELMNRKNR